MTVPGLPTQYDDVEYVRLETAAPYVNDATYLNHPTDGWVRVLDALADIEADVVVAAYADPETQEFLGLYKTWYPNTEDLIVPVSEDFIPEEINEAPDDVTPADALVAEITNNSNQNE